MKKIELSAFFKVKLKKWARKYLDKVHLLIEKLFLFNIDIQHPSLKTHKLTGNLNGPYVFSVDQDCRVMFMNRNTDEIILINVGAHDEGY